MKARHGVAVMVALLTIGARPVPVKLISNRAIYDVTLDRTLPGSVAAVRGRTVIEFRDACTGWSTAQRFIADMADSDGDDTRTDYIVTAWESKDGRTMRFDVSDGDDTQAPKRKTGTATTGVAGGQVMLKFPKTAQFALPAGTIFPTGYTIDIIAAAQSGQRSIEREVFQGGDNTDLYAAIATIGPKTVGKAQSADPDKLLKGIPAWPVLVSYFSDPQSETPDYEISSLLYANGVTGSMKLIYRHFTLNARLVKVEPLPVRC